MRRSSSKSSLMCRRNCIYFSWRKQVCVTLIPKVALSLFLLYHSIILEGLCRHIFKWYLRTFELIYICSFFLPVYKSTKLRLLDLVGFSCFKLVCISSFMITASESRVTFFRTSNADSGTLSFLTSDVYFSKLSITSPS